MNRHEFDPDIGPAPFDLESSYYQVKATCQSVVSLLHN
jgi:hypothetical protein